MAGQLDDTRLHWVAEIGGKRQEWDATIPEQRPDERVAWTSTSGAKNAGVVKRRAKGDLGRFKEFIENRGAETGAWRGEVGTTRRTA